MCLDCKEKFVFDLKKSTISTYNHFYYSNYTTDLKQLFYSVKFDSNKYLLSEFSKFFLSLDLNKCLTNFDYYVPIPYHYTRLNFRGYNVLDYLFIFLEKNYNIIKLPLLNRKKSTKNLSLYKKTDRSIILSDVFDLNPLYVKPKSKILLVDDIVTTKATMKAAINKLNLVSNIDAISCLSIIKV